MLHIELEALVVVYGVTNGTATTEVSRGRSVVFYAVAARYGCGASVLLP